MKRARAARNAALVVGALGFALMACQIIAGIERIEKVDPSAPAAPPDPCVHTQPPARTGADDDDAGTVPPFYLGVRTLTTSAPLGADPFGFDLDSVCTCRAGSGHDGGSSCKPKGVDCDGEGGVDNAAANLFVAFVPNGFSLDNIVNGNITKGQQTLIFYVSGYNGKPNDDNVLVGTMISAGIADGSGCNTLVDGFLKRAPPGWCGHDRWTYEDEFVKLGTKEPTGTAQGYVTNGQLVFRSNDPINVFIGTDAVGFGSPIVTATLGKNAAGSWTATGQIAGRVLVSDLLEVVGNFSTVNADGGSGLCATDIFGAVKGAICDAVDISYSSRFDFQGGACDSVSVSFSYAAEQVDIGDALDQGLVPGDCAKSKRPAGFYDCPP